MNTRSKVEDCFMRANRITIVALIVLETLVILQAALAYHDHVLTVEQMQAHGTPQGLPFVWHFAMWSDLVIISPLAAYLIGRYLRTWSIGSVAVSVALGTAVSLLMHWQYTISATSGVHVQSHALTPAGYGHLIYMALAIGIFTQVLLFTPRLERQVLAIVSVLLVLHVFVGTHMLLGFISLHYPQPWFPDRPLRSVFGWLTIVVTMIGLLWRNFQRIPWDVLAEPNKKWPWLKKPQKFVEYWTLQNFETTEKYLKLLEYIASYVGFSTFLGVFLAKLQFSSAFKSGFSRLENWQNFAIDTMLPCVLILLFAIIYFAGKQSVRMELAIGPKLFPPDRIPSDWGGPKDRVLILLTVVGFLLLFVLLTWFADTIQIASLIMFLLACNDWRTRYLINEGIRFYFKEEKYAPRAQDKDYDRILGRRAIAEAFLFGKPHLLKEKLRAVGCGVAFALSMFGYFNDRRELDIVAYIVLITVLVVNEWITFHWRYSMFWTMKEVDNHPRSSAAG